MFIQVYVNCICISDTRGRPYTLPHERRDEILTSGACWPSTTTPELSSVLLLAQGPDLRARANTPLCSTLTSIPRPNPVLRGTNAREAISMEKVRIMLVCVVT
jgi:hypothetical protein